MRRDVGYTGTLIEVGPKESETLEQASRRILHSLRWKVDWVNFVDAYSDLNTIFHKRYIMIKGKIYKINMTEDRNRKGAFGAWGLDNGNISFRIRYDNAQSNFDKAISEVVTVLLTKEKTKAAETINSIKPVDYVEACQRTNNVEVTVLDPDIVHGGIGCVTEAGELMDNIKRAMFYGAGIDIPNIIEELGDLSWYMSLLINAIGSSWEEVWSINIDKLKARYPDGFDEVKALSRDLQKERLIIEGEQ